MKWPAVVFLGLLAGGPTLAQEPDPVLAELRKESAWTGEGVPLVITLRSPGPFSGTASFDLPELPQTIFVKLGRPVVATEPVGDDSVFVQRHEFVLYTLQSGQVTLPSFPVRFAGKKTFTSDAEPMGGATPELQFTSKRPPGTEELGVVVAATAMEVAQTWSPDDVDTVDAGDVIQRTITQRAAGTTAMMLSPVGTSAPAGVRVYTADPTVQDRTERGESRAERRETIKYQFELAGTFRLPDLAVVWWDSEKQEVRRESLPGNTITVEAVAAAVKPREPEADWPVGALVLVVFVLGLVSWWGRRPTSRLLKRWRAERNSPEAVAAGRLLVACRRSDAPAAYRALVDWRRSLSERDRCARLDGLLRAGRDDGLQPEWTALARRVFGATPVETAWSGRRLADAFTRVRQQLTREARRRRTTSGLPALNPTDRLDR